MHMKLKKIAKTAVLLMLAVAVIGGLLLPWAFASSWMVAAECPWPSRNRPQSRLRIWRNIVRRSVRKRGLRRHRIPPSTGQVFAARNGTGFTASAGSHRLADRQDATAVEAADRRRLRIVCHR